MSKPPELIQLEADVDIIKKYIQASEFGFMFPDESLMMMGVLQAYEPLRFIEPAPPHDVEVAYRRITTECDCAAERFGFEREK
jgi:hypothetical protein